MSYHAWLNHFKISFDNETGWNFHNTVITLQDYRRMYHITTRLQYLNSTVLNLLVPLFQRDIQNSYKMDSYGQNAAAVSYH